MTLGGLADGLLIVYAVATDDLPPTILVYTPLPLSRSASPATPTPIVQARTLPSEVNPRAPTATQPHSAEGGPLTPAVTASLFSPGPAMTPETETIAAPEPTPNAAAITPLPAAGSPQPAEATLPSASTTPVPTGSVSFTGTPTPVPSDWSFVDVRLVPDPASGVLSLYGDMINNTGAAQAVTSISGTFYDASGQVVADEDRTAGIWPIAIVPPGAKVPFVMYVVEVQSAASFNLYVASVPSDQSIRQDFDFLDPVQSTENGNYCVEGGLRNPGSELQDYLVIAVVLYDARDQLINFDYNTYSYFSGVEGDETLGFRFCVDPLQQEVVRYELRAWGQ